MNYYHHNIGDYDSHTAHLTWAEDLAYRRLLCVYYRTEQPLPSVKECQRLVRATSRAEREAVEQVLREFFTETDGRWHHKRCDEEIVQAQERTARARENGNLGGRPKKPSGLSEKTQPVISGLTTDNPELTQTKAPNPNPNPSPNPSPNPEDLLQPSSQFMRRVDNPAISNLRAQESAGEPVSRETPEQIDAGMDGLKAAYPKTGRQNWIVAERKARQLIDDGSETWATLKQHAERYATHCHATGRIAMSPDRWLCDPDKPYSQPWEIPTREPTKVAAAAITWRPTE